MLSRRGQQKGLKSNTVCAHAVWPARCLLVGALGSRHAQIVTAHTFHC